MAPTESAASTSNEAKSILSVSQVTAEIQEVLDAAFSSVWVGGELSDLARPQSGHFYFTLKDDRSQLRAVIWRGTASRIRFDLEDGMEVVVHGRLDIYPPRGSYQLIVDRIEPKGVGAAELALRQLRAKLEGEGLFDPSRKRRLPRFPRRVAFVTSPTGAAIRDFLEVLRRRWQGVDVWVVPVRVQGAGASEEIAAAIRQVNELGDRVDVLVVGRGGGSVEDLWAFNEEPVAWAIAASRIPVVSAVGHEIDVTIADLVADVRALTPSEAAERIAPATDEMMQRLAELGSRLSISQETRVRAARTAIEAISSRRPFRRPHDLVASFAQQIDELARRSRHGIDQRIEANRQYIARIAAQLDSLSPLGVLRRGYSVTQFGPSGRAVRDASELTTGQVLETRFAKGSAMSRVESVKSSGDEQDG